MQDAEERFDFSDVSPEGAGVPPSEEDARPSLAEREAALEAAGLEQLSEKHRELNLERAGTVEEAAEMVKQEVEAEREDAVRETNEQTVRVEQRYETPLQPQEKAGMEELIARYNKLSTAYEELAKLVALEGEIESEAYKKALKTGEMPEMTSAGKKLNEVFAQLNKVRAEIGAVERRPAAPKQAETEEQARTTETPETPSPPPPPGGEGRVEWLRAQGREEEADAELQRQTLKKLEEEHGPTEEPEEVIELTEEMKKKPEEPAEKTDEALPETEDWTEVEDWQEGLKKKEEFEKLVEEKGFIDWTEVGEDAASEEPGESEKPEEPENEPEKRPAVRRLVTTRRTNPNRVPRRVERTREEQRPVKESESSRKTEVASKRAQERIASMRNAVSDLSEMDHASESLIERVGGRKAYGRARGAMKRLRAAENPDQARSAIASLKLMPRDLAFALPDDDATAFAEAAADEAKATMESLDRVRAKGDHARPAEGVGEKTQEEEIPAPSEETEPPAPETPEAPEAEPETMSGDVEEALGTVDVETRPEGAPSVDELIETMGGHLDVMEEGGTALPRKIKPQRLLKELTTIDAISEEQGKAILDDADARQRLVEAYTKEVKKRNKGKA